ncbi:hypothetical protein PQX77_014926 [Marasmius sp. AFHP31]|nr:hypothetical protein PQX77_014926 [Marasmius sp. AFHP31]
MASPLPAPLIPPLATAHPLLDEEQAKDKAETGDGDGIETVDAEASKGDSTSRSSATLGDFEAIVGELTAWLLLHEYDPSLNSECLCGTGECIVQCKDCQDFQICCKECWIFQHRMNPWHWARVWNGNYFVCSDISVLRKGGFAVQLGHHGEPCPLLNQPKPIKFTVIHSNGVHGSRLSFCAYRSTDQVQQLMHARLFPSSPRTPETAYTFARMREYDIQALQGQLPAYDWIFALQRLADNAHTHLVGDPYGPFMVTARVWSFIHDKLRYGELFSLIPHSLPHLPAETFITWCPSCPDPNMNMENEWWTTPLHLRHLIMMYMTLDRNSKTRRFRKRGGEADHSLYHGKSYFDDDAEYARFLKKAAKKNSM